MTHEFTDHVGRTRQLFKHRRAIKQHTAGEITTAELAIKPWFIRVQIGAVDQIQSLKTSDTREAVRLAKEAIRAAHGDNHQLAKQLQATATRGTITCRQVAEQWIAAGYPDPDNRPRQGKCRAGQVRTLERALDWFGNRAVATIGPKAQQDFVTHVTTRVTATAVERPRTSQTLGYRSAEGELTALSNCFAWAVARELIPTNPLTGTKKICRAEDIINHRLLQPDNADELHALAGWLWKRGDHVHAARILFGALTGLRPGEALPLCWHHSGMTPGTPGYRSMSNPISLGHTAPVRVEKLHVRREKGGINPAVEIHPALRDFLTAWREWSEQQAKGTVDGQPMFPCTYSDSYRIAPKINAAAEGLKVKANRFGHTRRTAHALRAYYVTVRRCMGAPDILIANELGQGTGAQMVRTYGADDQVLGFGSFGWLPTNSAPLWESFVPAPAKVIPFAPAVTA